VDVRHVIDRTDAELIHAAESDAGAFGELYGRHASTQHPDAQVVRGAVGYMAAEKRLYPHG
jgi:hypothetical protein